MNSVAKHLTIRGRVQGVGFRQFMLSAARELGITGWVRNRADGSVEAIIAGTPGAVAMMLERARRGPAHAQVTDFEITQAVANFGRFDALPTV